MATRKKSTPKVYEIADFDALVLDEALLSEAAARGTLRKSLMA